MWQSLGNSIKLLLLGALLTVVPWNALPGAPPILALAEEGDPEAPPPLPEDAELGPGIDEPPPDDRDSGPPTEDAADVEPINPGEAIVTRFSHAIDQPDAEGQPVRAIDLNGISASIIDIREPSEPPAGQHWLDAPQRMFVTAGEVGQVFGVVIANTGDETPDIFLTATAAFGLHRTGKAPGSTAWMSGMWGPDAGPGTIYRISLETGYLAEKFADVTLDGRANTGAALGNITHDAKHGRLFVSDLETGMIHSLDAATGKDLGHYDHGVSARASFLDVASKQQLSLAPIVFDAAMEARFADCPGDFSTTPECWNIADFRRRVWGLNVRSDPGGATRLFYSVWGSDAFGNPNWAAAGDDRRNSVWSVAINDKGLFDTSSIRREFFMPAFFPALPELGDKAGNSNAVSDISFPACGPQNVMLLAERGGMRNLGLDAQAPFARPHESRVLRFELGSDNVWRAKGRYDVGFRARTATDGPPSAFANAAGGASFGYKMSEDGSIDRSQTGQSVWMTGDSLCSAEGPCTDLKTGEHSDASEVHGIQGSPADVVAALEPSGEPGSGALDHSYMIDTDIGIDANGAPVALEQARNDATKIGDLAVHQVCEAAPPLPIVDEPDGETLPPVEPPDGWPVHTLNMSHEKWASNNHNRERSWHRREGSWHSINRSWHWRSQSYHYRDQTWHWRHGSWHSKAKSWHRKGRSLHGRNYSWHERDRSWHLRTRSFHNRARTWDGTHIKGRTYHVRNRTWGGQHFKNRTWGEHIKGRSFHIKGRTWGVDHLKGKSYHVKGHTWSGEHRKGQSYHLKDRTWTGDHVKGRTYHRKGRTWNDGDRPVHVKGKTYHRKGQTFVGNPPEHAKRKSDLDNQPQHVKGKTFHRKGRTFAGTPPEHAKQKSDLDNKPKHVKGKTFHRKSKTFDHAKEKSEADKKPKHVKGKSFHRKGKTFRTDAPPPPVHRKNRSFHEKATSKFVPAP